MKNTIKFLKTKLQFVGLTFAFLLYISIVTSCKDRKDDTSAESLENDQEVLYSTNVGDDKKFLIDSADLSLEIIYLGQLAQKNSLDLEVQKLGKMMETEHTYELKNLQVLATKKGITLPTSLTNEADSNKSLIEKRGKDFDKVYCDLMVNKHQDAITKYEKLATDSNDADIRNWATAAIPVLRKHLDHAVEVQQASTEIQK